MDKTKVIIFSLIGALLLGMIFIPGYLRIRKLARHNSELEQQITDLAHTNVRLREEYKKLKEDPVYLEKIARDKLGVARKGEIVYQVIPEEEEK